MRAIAPANARLPRTRSTFGWSRAILTPKATTAARNDRSTLLNSEWRYWGRLLFALAAAIVGGFILGSIVEALTDVVGWAAYLAIAGGVGGLVLHVTRIDP